MNMTGFIYMALKIEEENNYFGRKKLKTTCMSK